MIETTRISDQYKIYFCGIDTANKSCNWPVGKPNFVHKGVVKAVG